MRATYRSSPNGLGDTLMQHTVDITALIIEELYCEANVLADEVRTAFVPAATELMPTSVPSNWCAKIAFAAARCASTIACWSALYVERTAAPRGRGTRTCPSPR